MVVRSVLLATLVLSFNVWAESPPAEGSAPPAEAVAASATNAEISNENGPKESSKSEAKGGGSSRLRERLLKPDGKVSQIGILAPLDYTTLNYSDIAQTTLVNALTRYGDFPIKPLDDNLASLTIDDFRKIVTRQHIDVVIVLILKPTNFDMFMFDKRNPYQIYAHSEVLPEAVQYQISKEVVEEYTKVITRRMLYAYIQEQSYELPRQDITPVINAEIPRWIASAQSYRTINREILSSMYASPSVGAALATGNSKMWNSNLVGIQLGFRAFSNFFIEGNLDFFSYNSVGVALKYLANDLQSPLRFSAGLGGAMLMNQHTLNYDQNHTQGLGGTYLVASGAVLFPVVDLHFKVESRLYFGMGSGGAILTLQPGLMFLF